MTRLRLHDFGSLEKAAASPANLRSYHGETTLNGAKVRVRVESVNPEAGETGHTTG